MTSKKQTVLRLGLFLLIAFALTWIPDFICLQIWGFEEWLAGPFGIIVTLTMFAPMLGNILTRSITKEGWRDSLLHFHLKGNAPYYVIAFLIPALFGVIVAVITNVAHGNWTFDALADTTFTELFTGFLNGIITPIFYCSFCCFGEEFGWAGYMNPKLERLTGTVGAVVIGGILWGAWHGVLVSQGWNFGSEHPVLGVILMCVDGIFMNAIRIWLTHRTKSVFPAVLWHIALDNGLITLVMGLMISGISQQTAEKATALQIGILELVIAPMIVGTACFIQLLREKRNLRTAS